MLISHHNYLNSIEPSIQFTAEVEENGVLSFLDVTITRDEDGNLSTSVYKKPMHIGEYLHFQSNHPSKYKCSIVQTLIATLSRSPFPLHCEHKGRKKKDYGNPENKWLPSWFY